MPINKQQKLSKKQKKIAQKFIDDNYNVINGTGGQTLIPKNYISQKKLKKLKKEKSMSSLVKHAQRELELAGLFDKDSDYNGMLGKAVLDLIKVFAKQNHSISSADQTLHIFNKLSKYENLTPITSDPQDWLDINDILGEFFGVPLWQCKRNPAIFSDNGGKTWYSGEKPKKKKWYQFWK